MYSIHSLHSRHICPKKKYVGQAGKNHGKISTLGPPNTPTVQQFTSKSYGTRPSLKVKVRGIPPGLAWAWHRSTPPCRDSVWVHLVIHYLGSWAVEWHWLWILLLFYTRSKTWHFYDGWVMFIYHPCYDSLINNNSPKFGICQNNIWHRSKS